jgi:hypothetical protein
LDTPVKLARLAEPHTSNAAETDTQTNFLMLIDVFIGQWSGSDSGAGSD